MLDLGMGVAPVPKKIRNVELTPEQYDDFARIAGVTAKTRLDPSYARSMELMAGHVKHDVIVETIRQSREAARGMMMGKYPQIVKDAVELGWNASRIDQWTMTNPSRRTRHAVRAGDAPAPGP
jgi:hypothetical protein